MLKKIKKTFYKNGFKKVYVGNCLKFSIFYYDAHGHLLCISTFYNSSIYESIDSLLNDGWRLIKNDISLD